MRAFASVLFFDLYKLCKDGDKFLDGHFGGVDHQIVVVGIGPFLSGEEFVIVGTLLVQLLDVLYQLLVGHGLFVLWCLAAATLHAGGHIGVYENSEGVPVGKDIVGTASDDDAVALVGQLLDDGVLLGIDLGVEVHGLRGVGEEGSSNGDGIINDGLFFNDVVHVIFGKAASACDLGDDLVVIVCEAQLLGKTLAKLSSAAAELSVDGDDLAHSFAILSVGKRES